MLNWIVKIAISVWLTSTIFMLVFYFNAQLSLVRKGKCLRIPLGIFLIHHFCPVVHTYKCFKIMKRSAELAKERGM